MSSYQTIETPQDYVNYTFNISARGITEVAGEMAGLSNTVTTILGQLAFKTSEYLTHTESLVLGLGATSIAAFASATQEAIKFEQAIANVQAIGGESINAMEIGEAAMRYSSQFGMDVNSMTEGLEALSRAGLTATNVMSGVLAEGVKLSKLEGIDLEESINSLISTTNLLATQDIDVNSQEYADAVKAMNQHIVSTSESAPINAENIFQTLQHVGGYASANNINQEDLFAVIAQLGAKGTKGEMAGTALRAFIAAGQKDQAQRALARIGLNVSDLWSESGEAMLPISEMKDVIDNALEARGYSKQEKLEFYSDFAGYKQANQIMKIDTSEVKEYKDNIAQAWDLGKKLEVILGTTHNNLQILFQTVKNFMTRVGKTMLPIINAIIIPIKLGVQLLEKIPFSENITGLLLAVTGIKAVLLFINRVLPTLASMYTSFTRSEKEAGKIRKHFSNIVEDIREAKSVLSNINDPMAMSKKRLEKGFMGEQSYKVHQEVTKQLYAQYAEENPDLTEWDDLTSVERQSVTEIMEAYKSTEKYQDALNNVITKHEKITAHLDDFLLQNTDTQTSKVNQEPKIFVTQEPRSKRDINREVSIQQQANKESFQHASQKIPVTTGKDVFKPQTDNEMQNNIAKGIIAAKGPLAEAIGRALSESINVESAIVSDTLGTFKLDKIKSDKITQQLQDIEKNVSNNLGDIGYFLDDDLDIDALLSNVKFDLQNKITAYTNNDPNFMNVPQETRMRKIVSGAARTNLGKLYSEEQNSIDILNVLRGEKWNEPKDKRLGIHNRQMDEIEKALHIDNRSDLERVDRLNNIHKELNNRYKGKAKDAKIAEILEITAKTWRDEISHDMPGAGASKYLTNSRAAFIGNTIGIQGIDWNKTDNAAQQLIEYFKDTQDGTRKAQQLRDADNLMFTIMEQAKGENAVFNQMEADEIGYLIRRYRQLLEARNKILDRENNKEEEIIENIISNASAGFSVKYDSKNHRRVFYPEEINEWNKSNYNWEQIPTVYNTQERMQDLLKNGLFTIDNEMSELGLSKRGEIAVNIEGIMNSILEKYFLPKFYEVITHEIGHSLLQHTLRGHTITPLSSDLIIPGAVSQEGEEWGEPISEYEAMSVSKKVLTASNIKLPKSFLSHYQELEELIIRDYGDLSKVRFDLIDEAAKEMIKQSNGIFEIMIDLLESNQAINDAVTFPFLDLIDYANTNARNPNLDSIIANANWNGEHYNGNGDYPGRGYLSPEERMVLGNAVPVNVSVDFPDEITVSFVSSESEKFTSIQENLQKITDEIVNNAEDNSALTIKNKPKEVSNSVQFIVQGDLHITGTGEILTPDTVINTDRVTMDTRAVPMLEDNTTSFDENAIKQLQIMFPSYEDLDFIINEEIYSAAATSVMTMLSTVVDNVEFEINSLRKFVSTFLFFTKGIEIIDKEVQKQEDESQKVIDDFNSMTKGIATQWLQLSIIIQSFLDLFEEEEQIEENLKSQINELNQNVPKFAEYLLGHSLVSVEDVSSELSQYVQDTIKNVIDEVFNPPEKFVQIPTESTGALEELKEKNKQARIKDSGEEIIIGRYRVPGGPPGGVMPKNLMPGGYPQAVKDQLEQNRLNRLSRKDTDAQAQRYARAKAKSDGEAMVDDLLSTAHNIHNELATKHIQDPNSLTQNELDFIGLNKERDERRRKKRDNDVTIEDLEKARIGTTWTQHHKSEIQKDKDRKDRLRRGATNEDITRPPSVVDHRQYENPIGPNKPSTGKEMAAKILGKSLDEIDKTSQKLRDERYDEKIIELVDKNFINEEEPYVPTAHMYSTTGIGQASALYKENQAINELINFYQSQEQIVEAKNNLALENENKKLENIERERKNLLREEENAEYRDWHRNELQRRYETAPWTLTDNELRKIGVDPATIDRTSPKKQPSQEFLDKQARADAFWADIEELEKQGEKDAFWADIERQEKEALAPHNKERADRVAARVTRQQEANKEQEQRQRQLELKPIKKEIQEELNTVKDAFTFLMDTDKKMVEISQTLNPMRKQSEFWDEIDKLEQEGIQEQEAKKRKDKIEKANKAAARVRTAMGMQLLEQQYDNYAEQASQHWRTENFKRRFYQGKEERDARRDKRKADEEFWKNIEKLEEQGIREHKNKPAFDKAQQELLTVAHNISIERQKNAIQQEFVQAQRDLLNIAKNITEEEKQKQAQEKRLKYLHNLKKDINDVNQFWEDSSDTLYGASGFLDSAAEAVDKFVKLFPPLAVISTPIHAASQKMQDLVEVFELVEEGIGTVKVLNSDITKEEAEAVGLSKEYANAQLIKKVLGDNTFVGPLLEGLGVNVTAMFDIGKSLMSIIAKELGVFIAANASLILPPLAAIIAAVGILSFAEKRHAQALKEATEEQEKAHKEVSASYITYQNLHDARQNETDAMKRQQLARKESIALYNLEADRVKNLNAINKKSELRGDSLWGEYGLRASLQKMGLGFIAGGDFESQYENYEGTTGNIRRIKEDALGNLGATSSQRAVSKWYDNHKMQLGQIEAFAPQLQELYDKESSLIEKYGSLEEARASEEFAQAVQEFANATGLNRETAEKYLDYLQTEQNVDNARKVMEAEVRAITAKADAEAMKAIYGDTAGMGDSSDIQDAMVYATADQIFKDAMHEMWWKQLMEWLTAIYDVLTFQWIDAGKHAKAAGAYQKGMKELTENQKNIVKDGFDAANADERGDYGNQQYEIDYGDTLFSGAYASMEAEPEYAGIPTKSAQSPHTVINDGLSAASASMSPSYDEQMQQYSSVKGRQISHSKLDVLLNRFQHKVDFAAQDKTQNEILNVNRKIYTNTNKIAKGYDVNQWYASGHNNGDNSLSARTKNALWYDKGFGLPPGVDPNDPAVQEELSRRRRETAAKAGGHAAGGGFLQYLFGANGRPIGAKSAAKKGTELAAHLLNPEEVAAPTWYSKIFGKNSDEVIEVSGHVVDDAAKIAGKNTDDVLKLGTKGIENAGKTGARRTIPIVAEETGEQAIKVGIKKGAKNGGRAGTTGLVKAGEAGVVKTGGKSAGKAGAKAGEKAGVKGVAKATGKSLAKALPFVGPAVTAAFSIAEHNPFEKHYNEDGSEKRALQSTGEVVGEIGGSLVAAGLGAAATALAIETGPFAPIIGGLVETGASLILEPVGKAVGGFLGWAGDELFNNTIGLIFGNGEEGQEQVNPSDISNQVDANTFDSFQQSFNSSDAFNNIPTGANTPLNAPHQQPPMVVKVENIYINTNDDPEKIKDAFLDLMIELSDQVTPRTVSRTTGKVNSDNSTTTDSTTNNNTASDFHYPDSNSI